MTAVGELKDFRLEFVKPGGFFRKPDLAGLDLGRLRAHARDFVVLGFYRNQPEPPTPEILDEAGAGPRILDEKRGYGGRRVRFPGLRLTRVFAALWVAAGADDHRLSPTARPQYRSLLSGSPVE